MGIFRYFVFLLLMILILFLVSCSSGGSTGNPTGDSDAAESTDQSENEISSESEEENSQGLLSASPEEIHFGAVVLGDTSTETLTLTNDGEEDLTISVVWISEATTPEFSVQSVLQGDQVIEVPVVLVPGQNLAVVLQYAPVDAGSDTGTLQIIGEGFQGNLLEISLFADEKGESGLDVTPRLEFGYAGNIGEEETQSLTIWNLPEDPQSNRTLQITKLELTQGSRDFDLDVDTCTATSQHPILIAPGLSHSCSVVFSPREAGELTGAIRIETNASEGEAGGNIDLSGRCAPPETVLTLVVNPRGEPVPGAELRLWGEDAVLATTDSRGRAVILPEDGGQIFAADGATSVKGVYSRQYKKVLPEDEVSVFVVDLLPVETSQGIGLGQVSASNLPGALLKFSPEDVALPDGAGTALFMGEGHPSAAPYDLPEGQELVQMFHFGPDGTIFVTPAQLTLPNSLDLAPGERIEFHSFDESTLLWKKAAVLEVNAEGTLLETIEGGISHFSAGGLVQPEGSLPEYTVTGLVQDDLEQNLSDIRVFAMGARGRMLDDTTNDQGSYTISGIRVSCHKSPYLTVAASRNGTFLDDTLTSVVAEVSDDPSQTVQAPVLVLPNNVAKGSIRGKALSPLGTPVENARVTVYPALGWDLYERTDSQGRFVVSSVPAGTARVEIKHDGLGLSKEISGEVPENGTWNLGMVILDEVADIEPPRMLWSMPTDGQENLVGLIDVRVVFNETIDPASLQATLKRNLTNETISGSATLENGTTVVFTPDVNFEDGRGYTFTLGAGLADLSGNTLGEEFILHFQTVTPTCSDAECKSGIYNWGTESCGYEPLANGTSCRNNHGSCNGNGECVCNNEYMTEDCSACQEGFIDYPDCRDDPCVPDPCNGHGSCDSGDGSCTCDNVFMTDDCGACLDGYEGYPDCEPEAIDGDEDEDEELSDETEEDAEIEPSPGFVSITAGTFWMGSPDGDCPAGYPGVCIEEPGREFYSPNEVLHEVTLTYDFEMQTQEMTQGEWFSAFGNNPSYFGPTGDGADCGDNCPVERVNWVEVLAYANWLSVEHGLAPCYTLTDCTGTLGGGCASSEAYCDTDTYSCTVSLNGVEKPQDCEGYRLPTEAEWEYAIRVGNQYTAFYQSNGNNGAITYTGYDPVDPNLDQIGWFAGNNDPDGTKPVGGKEANAWGLYDMSGNVLEWVWDWYQSDYETDVGADPVGPSTGSGRVFRGGSWLGNTRYCRSANRYDYSPGYRFNRLGFRLVRSMHSDFCIPDHCNSHGTCDDTNGYALCDCNTGYDGADCSVCTEGYEGYPDCVMAVDGDEDEESETDWDAPYPEHCQGELSFADANLEAALRDTISKPSGDITLADVESLTEVNWNSKGILDLEGIECLYNLERLSTFDNGISDVSPLAELMNLETVFMTENSLTNASNIADLTVLPNLKALFFDNNNIRDLTLFDGMTSLETLDVSSNGLVNADFAEIPTITTLRELHISFNNIDDLTPAQRFPLLEYLSAGYMEISDLSPISGIITLKSLHLTNSSIDSLADISALVGLEYVYFDNNDIQDLGPLQNKTSLRVVNVKNNQITDLSPLVNNAGIGIGDSIDVSGNPLNCTEQASNIQALQASGVDLTTDCEVVDGDEDEDEELSDETEEDVEIEPSPGFVPITAGTFWMGSPDGDCPAGYPGACIDEPGRESNEDLHEVTLTYDFEMQAYEVTEAEFEDVMSWNPVATHNAACENGCGDSHPVKYVSWYDVLAYANELSLDSGLTSCYVFSGVECEDGSTHGSDYMACMNATQKGIDSATVTLSGGATKPQDCEWYRLPTEAEWEYAIRVGNQYTAFYQSNGNDGTITYTGYDPVDPNLDQIGWFNDPYGTKPVGGKEANGWGLYDMSGNVSISLPAVQLPAGKQ